MISKKGASHIEIIFAFIIFVGFVIFLLYYIQPFKTDTLEDAALISLKDNFFREASVNLTTVLVNFSENGNQSCKVTNIPGINSNFKAKAINTSKSNQGFYYIYYSDAPDFSTGYLADCPTGNYPYGDINEMVVLSDFKLANFIDEYKGNYEAFKAKLGLSPNADFTVLANEYILEKRAPDQIKVIAGAYRKQVLKSDATLINKDFIIKVW